ncbi:trypsin-like serine protease [Chloroflexus sp. Y-396-1]|uniref:trypsin-like serine protease n=1 Tax=Chloroflexus sp. Y-396-1 TaxID=867845 RepID=UPI0004B899E0|nr:trypsin-like serine protease [Chloroflexus sp. Y-396-1]
MRKLFWRGTLFALIMMWMLPSGALSRPLPPPTLSIVGGEPVQPGDYPWLVALLDASITDEAFAFCGGALIDDGGDFTTTQWVLTAAHCLVSEEGTVAPNAVEVLVGQQDLSQATAAQRKSVATIIAHPLYIEGSILANDIALLRLADPVTGITPIKIATLADAARFAVGTTAQIAGWGNRLPQTGLDFPDVAHKASVPIVDLATCNERYSGGLNESLHLCAGQYPSGGIDTCQGDSGGPLMVPDGSGGLLHAGIVSFGIGCAWPNFPGVYAKTASFADWITAQINNQPHVDVWQLQLYDPDRWYLSAAAPDEPFEYVIFVANSGPTTLSDVEVFSTVPAGATLVTGSISDGGVYDSGTSEVIWSVGSLDPGEVITLTYQVQAASDVTANIYRVEANAGSLVRGNIRGSVVTRIDQPLPLVFTSSPSFSEVGSVFPVVFTIFNAGLGVGADLVDLELVVDLPPDVEVVAIRDGGVESVGQIRWSISDLPANNTVEVAVFLRAGAVGDFARITNVELLDGETRLVYGEATQTVFVPAVRYLPIIEK